MTSILLLLIILILLFGSAGVLGLFKSLFSGILVVGFILAIISGIYLFLKEIVDYPKTATAKQKRGLFHLILFMVLGLFIVWLAYITTKDLDTEIKLEDVQLNLPTQESQELTPRLELLEPNPFLR